MTNEEAIARIDDAIDNEFPFYLATEEFIEPFRIARAALEKQIPKPKHKYQGYRCVCGKEVAKKQKYCEYCGQKLLDWSDDDDKDRA